MRVFHKLDDIAPELQASAVAIGNFDGVHLGHVELLKHMLAHARSSGASATVLTFFPHPVEVLNPSKKLLRLTTASEKLGLLEKMGVEVVLVQQFDRNLAEVSPAEFFERFLVRGLKAKSIHVGFDFSFGKGRVGNTELLGELARQNGIHLKVEGPHLAEGQKISSSVIRQQLAEGEVTRANALLGRPYVVAGQVVKGDQRGAALGFPTANVHCPVEKVLPRNGVYVTRVVWQKQTFRSVTNVGLRPTFLVGSPPTVEAHLLDFNARLYDEFLEVQFLERVRDEKKFESIEALKAQIEADVAYARRSKLS